MAANTSPIYSLTPKVSSGIITSSITALLASDGSGQTGGSASVICYTAGSNAGSFVSKIRISYCNVTAYTATTATTLRFFVSSAANLAGTTNVNTWLIQEVSTAAITPSATVAQPFIEIPLNFALPANYLIIASTGTVQASANCSLSCVVFGGDY